MEELETRTFASQAKWATWLDKNHAKSPGLWIKIAKKGSGIPSITYAEAVEVALCYGWIDGLMRRVDDDYFVQRFTPRRARSKWSKINRVKVQELIENGKMKPAGLAEIERAKADGRWDAAYDSPSTMEVPDDLRKELRKNKKAGRFFEVLSASDRYSILHQIQDAKKPETRARRIARFVQKLEAEQRPR